jgi:hypothetical protein
VSWNAFKKGNKLAKLALALAIVFDVMVFFAAVRGARIVLNPLDAIGQRQAGRRVEAASPRDLMQTMDAVDITVPPPARSPAFPAGTFVGAVSQATLDAQSAVAAVLKRGSGATFTLDNQRHAVVYRSTDGQGQTWVHIHKAFFETMEQCVDHARRSGQDGGHSGHPGGPTAIPSPRLIPASWTRPGTTQRPTIVQPSVRTGRPAPNPVPQTQGVELRPPDRRRAAPGWFSRFTGN